MNASNRQAMQVLHTWVIFPRIQRKCLFTQHFYVKQYFFQSIHCFKQTMVDMTAYHPVNEILAIRRYHVIYNIQSLSDAVHQSVESKRSA